MGRGLLSLALFEERQCFVEAAALQVMGEVRVDWSWEFAGGAIDLLGGLLEAHEVSAGIPLVQIPICNDAFAFAESVGKARVRRACGHLKQVCPRL